ncbi:uncharacterized protein MONBRDRAFT_24946 [Monosiga brevicollis MX1]|uniref:KIF-binding protein n=1 Tax=Monosiga brevicollis TaxID=81824 RepID=A9UY78_MONBE|nr:uncharacterized protein MONBRDRAFT_24946 [Monosiga brevicollis MX1]EDQ89977.1 predicted protein [Monosiga brevicollis MX1]|eukprot:XP_001745399.1 hypothetical protein [Monosiga brevicollis MX1]
MTSQGGGLMRWLAEEATKTLQDALELQDKPEPEEAPFQHKYEARKLLVLLQAQLAMQPSDTGDADVDAEQIKSESLARILFQLGVNHSESEETSEGQKLLDRAREIIADDVDANLQPRRVALAIAIHNHLGIVWAGLGEVEQAMNHLQQADRLYRTFVADHDPATAWLHTEFVDRCSGEERRKGLETAHTLTSFYLAQAYGNLGQRPKMAEYIQRTLQRQLEFDAYQPLEWAVHAAALSQYFMTEAMWQAARHCLACASFMRVADVERSGPLAPMDMASGEEEERQRQHASISMCWVKYFLNLLDEGKRQATEEASIKEVASQDFVRFDLDVLPYEDDTPVRPPTDYETAKHCYIHGTRHLNEALKFYTLQDHATDHVACLQDNSAFFRHLADYTPDPDIASKMHKRRADLLEAIAGQLNSQYFLAVCKQLRFELGEIYMEMYNIKYQRLKDSGDPDPKAIAKVNRLIALGRKNFITFIAKRPDLPYAACFPRTYPPARIGMGRSSHVLTADVNELIQFHEDSLMRYTYIVDYCNKHPVPNFEVR